MKKCGELPRQANMTETIGTIAGDLHIKDFRTVGLLYIFHNQAGINQRFLSGGCGRDGIKIPGYPVQSDFHSTSKTQPANPTGCGTDPA